MICYIQSFWNEPNSDMQFEQMQQHAVLVKEAIAEIQNIRESINDLTNIEERPYYCNVE